MINATEKKLARFIETFAECQNIVAPQESVYKKGQKFDFIRRYRKGIAKLSNKKRILWHISRTTGNHTHFEKAKKKLNNFLKYVHEKESQKLFSSLSTQEAKWKHFNEFTKDNEVKLKASRNPFGTKLTDPKQMADLMNYKIAILGQFYLEYQTEEIIKSHNKK